MSIWHWNARGKAYIFSADFLYLITILMIGLLLRVLFMNTTAFQSDDSLYLYSSYAVSKGLIPYREVLLSHPPLTYYIYAFFIAVVGPNLGYIRLLLSGVFLLNGVLTYVLARVVLANKADNRIVSLLAISIYIFNPILIHYSLGAMAEFILSLFILVAVLLYISSARSRLSMFFVGIFLGFACLTKVMAGIFGFLLILYHTISSLRLQAFKNSLMETAAIIAGMLAPIILLIGYITFIQNTLSQFYLQVINPYMPGAQGSIPPFTFSQRWGGIAFFINTFLPFLVTGVIGMLFYLFDKVKKSKQSPLLFLVFIYVSNTLILCTVFTTFFFHYLWYLTPYLAFLSAYGLVKTISSFRIPKTETMVFILLLTLPLIAQATLSSAPYFQENPTPRVERYVGEVVADYSNPSDRIWTSEGAIAFFAQRLIIPPNSPDRPFQAFFSDVFDVTHVVVPRDFVDAWEANKIKVIVIIRGSGWVPYPDTLLWSGYEGQVGAAEYIIEKYELKSVVQVTNSPYAYEVWVRK